MPSERNFPCLYRRQFSEHRSQSNRITSLFMCPPGSRSPNGIAFFNVQGCTFNMANERRECVFPLHRVLVFYGLFGSHPLHPYLLHASIDGMQVPLHNWPTQIFGRFVIRRQLFNCIRQKVRTSTGEWR